MARAYVGLLCFAVVHVGVGALDAQAPIQATSAIRLNTVGYPRTAAKLASIAGACESFSVVRISDGATVLTGGVRGPLHNADTDEDLFVADFSALRESGEYRLVVPGVGESALFRVAHDVYVDAFRTVTRAMYRWRCGTAVRTERSGNIFSHAACHLDDAWLDHITGQHERRDATGGWHDAGDYNKYVINAGVTVGVMLRAWEEFGPAIARVRLDLPAPESGGALPAFLAEIKWEIDWLLKMQVADGSVFHKVSTQSFGGFVRPETETTPRYFVPWSSTATADFVAIMAAASRSFQPHDPAYAERCVAAARKSYAFLLEHPDDHRPDQSAFRTGAYSTPDDDERLWAAAEMWEATGDAAARRDCEARARVIGGVIEDHFDWGNVANLGLLTYLFSNRPDRDPQVLASVRTHLLAAADRIVSEGLRHGYARPLGTRYFWGCNGGVARQAVLLQAAHRLSPDPRYVAAALDAVHHILGRNVHGRSYVTGVGSQPPLHPHCRMSGSDDVAAPWPGYLVGGPNPGAADWHDVQRDYRTNETAINWNAALIYALAGFLESVP